MKYIVKNCKKCNVEFNTRPFYNKEYCKKCWNNLRMRKAYRILHPDKKIIYVRGNPTESKRQWAERNREKIKEIIFRYRYKRDGVEKDKEWVKNNPEKVEASRKRYRNNPINKEKKRIWHLEDRRSNPEKYKERGIANCRKYPEKYKENCRRRRVKKLNCDGFHTCKEFNDLKIKTGSICLCCGIPERELKIKHKSKKYWKLTEDHIIPLSEEGTDDIENIQPLCFHCNVVKNSKIISLEELRKII